MFELPFSVVWWRGSGSYFGWLERPVLCSRLLWSNPAKRYLGIPERQSPKRHTPVKATRGTHLQFQSFQGQEYLVIW